MKKLLTIIMIIWLAMLVSCGGGGGGRGGGPQGLVCTDLNWIGKMYLENKGAYFIKLTQDKVENKLDATIYLPEGEVIANTTGVTITDVIIAYPDGLGSTAMTLTPVGSCSVLGGTYTSALRNGKVQIESTTISETLPIDLAANKTMQIDENTFGISVSQAKNVFFITDSTTSKKYSGWVDGSSVLIIDTPLNTSSWQKTEYIGTVDGTGAVPTNSAYVNKNILTSATIRTGTWGLFAEMPPPT